jgi:hypothetical protein
MPHVDEGQIAALLDAQLPKEEVAAIERHLANCDECRNLVAETRRSSDRARAILRTAMGRGRAAPSFEDVLERSKIRGGHRSQGRRLSRLSKLAWAASVVLAIAVGWFARDSRLIDEMLPPVASDISTTAPAEAMPQPPAAPAITAPAPGARRDQAPPAQNRAPSSQKKELQRRASEPLAATAPAPSPPSPAPRTAQELAQTGTAAAEQSLDAAKQGQAEPAAAANATEGRAADAPAIARSPDRTLANSIAKSSVEEGWYEATRDEATRRLGRRPLVVPGIPVTGYAVVQGSGATVRVTQQLPNGGVLALVQRRTEGEHNAAAGFAERRQRSSAAAPGAAPALRDEARPAVDGATIERDGYHVTAQAAVGRDSLAALLRSLR